MNLERALRAAVLAAPSDPTPRWVYADYLEELGDPACDAWRWLAQQGRRPFLSRTTYVTDDNRLHTHEWWCEPRVGGTAAHGHGDLHGWESHVPPLVFGRMRGYWFHRPAGPRVYETAEQAYEDFVQAFLATPKVRGRLGQCACSTNAPCARGGKRGPDTEDGSKRAWLGSLGFRLDPCSAEELADEGVLLWEDPE